MKGIEWATNTWNPITGCTPVSEGCQHCYARRMAMRLAGRFGYPEDEPFRVTFHHDRLKQPMRLRRPSIIFVCSMGDLFHEDVSFTDIKNVVSVTFLYPQHKFLLLTKRPKRMKEFSEMMSFGFSGWPPSNIWFGVTAENQRCADERIPILMDTYACMRFVSVEPMLEPMSLKKWIEKGLNWVIAGPETGPGARPMERKWLYDLSEECLSIDTPFFDKKNVLGKGLQEWAVEEVECI